MDEAEFERLVETDAFDEELSGSDSDGDEAEEGGGGVPVEGRARLMLRDATGAHLLLWRAVLGGQMFGAAGATGAGPAALVALRQLAAARKPPLTRTRTLILVLALALALTLTRARTRTLVLALTLTLTPTPTPTRTPTLALALTLTLTPTLLPYPRSPNPSPSPNPNQAREPPPVWVVVLCRGGHFAAAAFELRLPPKGAASRRGEECVKLLAHRCYHRYVTRRNARALP